MKLFLASSLDKTIQLLNDRLKNNHSPAVAFIANAADPFTETWWVEADRTAFLKNNFTVKNIDIKNISQKNFEDQLQSCDSIHFCGGSVFYLLHLLKINNLDTIVKKLVLSDKLVYTGTSAGSIIASVDTKIYIHDPEETKYAHLVSDYSGLGFIPFVIVPHCNNPEFIDANKAVIEQLPNFEQALLCLTDNQAVWVENNQFTLLQT